MTRHALVVLVACCVSAASWAAGKELHGRTHVLDGDTIVADGIHVRLQGIAAPELSEAGGAAARDYLREQAEGRMAVCALTGEHARGREVGVCRVDGKDIAELVIAAGLARDCPRYSGGRYALVERASAAGLPFPSYCVPRR